ncbi:hypothetical protein NE237_012005 [Protea cynaroides]|uniref:HAT C-terminal dimerisation domain-containing protein n=1 Tax=Protea cynaroides TaxID=273540 RepID=A0A9Q0GW28_9MAGN|nr:hypothetical protein NE237_012005 [Protea cynaroides]
MENEEGIASPLLFQEIANQKSLFPATDFRSALYNSLVSCSVLQIWIEPRLSSVKDFKVLAYWKVSEAQYTDLLRLVRDILANPVSTIASESAFSAGGRVRDKYRSKLPPKNVEALVCLRDWLYDVNCGGCGVC